MPLLIVHLNVELAPLVNVLTADVGEPTVVTVAVPLNTLHAPVPITGVLPNSALVVTLHNVWSLSALEVVGNSSTWILNVSTVGEQPPSLIVHVKVAVAPMVKLLIVVVGELTDAIVAAPVSTFHVPVPDGGVFPAIVVVVVLHSV